LGLTNVDGGFKIAEVHTHF